MNGLIEYFINCIIVIMMALCAIVYAIKSSYDKSKQENQDVDT